MYTVIETPVYSSKVLGILTDDERDALAAFIAANPTVGAVLRGSGGVRKVRKIERSTIPAHELKVIKEAIGRD